MLTVKPKMREMAKGGSHASQTHIPGLKDTLSLSWDILGQTIQVIILKLHNRRNIKVQDKVPREPC